MGFGLSSASGGGNVIESETPPEIPEAGGIWLQPQTQKTTTDLQRQSYGSDLQSYIPVDGEIIFFCNTDGVVYSVNSNDITETIWTYSTGDELPFPTDGGTVFTVANVLVDTFIDSTSVYVSPNSTIYSLDKASGQLNWSYDADDEVPNMVVSGSSIFFGDASGSLYRINKSGGEVWKVNAPADEVRSVVVGETSVYAGGDTFVSSHSIIDGSQNWQNNTSNNDPSIFSRGVQDGSHVYFGGDDGAAHLKKYDKATGGVETTFDAGDAIVGDMILFEGDLFFGTIGSSFYSVNSEALTENWNNGGSFSAGGHILYEELVLTSGTTGGVNGLRIDDGTQEINDNDDNVNSDFGVTEDSIIFGTDSGDLVKISRDFIGNSVTYISNGEAWNKIVQ
jgi:hypothetical protein